MKDVAVVLEDVVSDPDSPVVLPLMDDDRDVIFPELYQDDTENFDFGD